VTNNNIGSTSHRFRDVTSFPLKNAHFSIPPFNTKFQNVRVKLHPPNFVRREPRQRANYSCKKFSRKIYRFATIHLWQTTDKQTTTIT